MKPLTFIKFASLVTLIAIGAGAYSQEKVVVKEKNKKSLVAKTKRHRARKAVIYHPYWTTKLAFKNRWVYFPKYNFYWDNVKRVYVIRTGTIWVVSKNKPQEVKDINLENEKILEIDGKYDDQDDVGNIKVEDQSI